MQNDLNAIQMEIYGFDLKTEQLLDFKSNQSFAWNKMRAALHYQFKLNSLIKFKCGWATFYEWQYCYNTF